MPTRSAWVVCAGLLMASGATAQTVGDADAGRALAQRWCTSCHVIDPTAHSASATGAPTFPGIARMVSTTALSLSAFLQTPHDRMPDLHLSHDEIADVTAFILSLKPR